MPTRVVLWDPLPAYRAGLIEALHRADIAAEATENIVEWSARRHPAVAIVTIEDGDVEVVIDLRAASPQTEVVALVGDASPASLEAAIRAGVIAPVARAAPPEQVVRVVTAALKHETLMPGELVHALLNRGPVAEPTLSLPAEQIDWLRQLSHGTTVYELAQTAGYSQREMFRRLRSLYRKMGAGNRTDALLRATRWGWL